MNRNIQSQITPDRGVNIRMPSTALLGVSSADRYPDNLTRQLSGTSPFNILLTSKQNYLNGFFTRIALTEVRLPWYMQTITARNNKINLVYRVGLALPVTFTITINAGWYTPLTLAAELQRAIRAPVISGGANKPSFTVVYNASPNPFIFFGATNVVGDTFYFETEDALPNNQNSTGLYEMMNWSYPGGFQTVQGSGIPTMLSTEFVDIVSSSLTYAQDVKDGDTEQARDVVARIYLAKDGVDTDPSLLGSAPFVVYRQFQTPKQIKWDSNLPIGQLQFQFYDDKGFLLDSGFGPAVGYDESLGDWSLTLLVSEV
jgi:hypothetical protein